MGADPRLRGRAARLARLFPAGRARAARTPFVFLVVLLLGGGLLGLLVLNSALSEGSFQLDDLQRQTKNLTDEEQALQRDIDAYSSPDALQRRARELGMVPGGDPAFLGPNGTVRGVPSAAPGSVVLDRPRAPEAMTSSGAPAAGATQPAATPDAAPTTGQAGGLAPVTPSAPLASAPATPSAARTAGAAGPAATPRGTHRPAPTPTHGR